MDSLDALCIPTPQSSFKAKHRACQMRPGQAIDKRLSNNADGYH
jgi:hypothetical protein